MASMTISRWTAAGGIAGALLLGLLLGRWAAPAKIVERDRVVTSERDTELSWHAYVGHVESRTETKVAWKTETKWLPGGTVVQTVVAHQEHSEASTTDTTVHDAKVREVVKYKEVEHTKLVEAKKIDWLLGAGVGTRFDRLTPVYDVEVARRVLGPLFVGAWGQAGGLDLAGGAAGFRLVFAF